MTVRTRMAPSPTGEFHIGSMRTLLYNYALAKKNDGKFVLRIEDTDRTRHVEGAMERTMQVIKDYGLAWDEGPDTKGEFGPYIQSERLDLYKKYAEELVEQGNAYYCFCSKERLDVLRKEQQSQGMPTTKYDKHCLNLSKEEVQKKLDAGEDFVIRLNVPKNEDVKFNDAILGEVSINTDDIDDQVLLKSDGFPTYHLAVVVDDYLMEISHILRGIEWLPSTPKHILLYKAFGWEIPQYAHVPLLKEKGSNKKMSKRDGSVSAVDFLAEGYLPEALLNFLMFLGWNPGTEKEIYSLEEFIGDFSLEKIHKTDLVAFDRDKLLWMNGQYIRALETEVLHKRILAWASRFDVDLPKDFVSIKTGMPVAKLVQERLKVFKETPELISYFYEEPKVEKELLVKFAKEDIRAKEILTAFIDLYESLQSWDVDNLDKISHELLEQKSYKPKEAFMTVRIAISGQTATPPLFDTLGVLGKETSLKRLKSALQLL